MDSFYKVLNEEERKLAAANQYNFDHPHSFDWPLLMETIQKLKEGKRVEVPIYNFATHSREKETNTMYGANVIICEGILLFSQKQVLDMLDMKVMRAAEPSTLPVRKATAVLLYCPNWDAQRACLEF